MNLLLVDDEYYCIEGLRASIDWFSFGITNIFCAYNMQQARDFYLKQKIDIMISDIEMPKGSGLDLLKWVRGENYNTVTIFLTSFANFNYASNALKLQSTDYLLKPVDSDQLTECVLAAINKVRQQENEELYKQKSKFWDNNKRKLEEQFWNALCMEIIPGDARQIANEVSQYHLPQKLLSGRFYLALLHTGIKREKDTWETNLYEFAIKNIINELLEPWHLQPVLARINEKQYVLCLTKNDSVERSFYLDIYRRIIKTLKHSLPGIFQLYISTDTSLLYAGRNFRKLYDAAYNNISEECKLIDTTLPAAEKCNKNLTSLNEWSSLLMQHKKNEVKEQALQFLSELKQSSMAKRSDLVRFNHDFMQIIYTILEKNGESAHRLFDDNTSEQSFEQACNSVETMKIWVCHVIDVFDACLSAISQSDSSIELIRKYIREHLDEDLNRKKLASLVYLSPDYLSHVFSERTGESLTAFILNERIKRAKELLLLSQKSIRDIALTSGFPNISYFSRQFKCVTGKTPQEYRKK